jgi:hypothetical protein
VLDDLFGLIALLGHSDLPISRSSLTFNLDQFGPARSKANLDSKSTL